MDYVSTSLQLAPQNKYINVSFMDLVNGIWSEPDKRTGAEIAQDVMRRAGLTFGSTR